MLAAEILLRLVGVFYVFAGIVGLHMMAMERMLDQALAAITLKPVPREEKQKQWLMGISTMAIGMGGTALLVLSLWAVPLLLVGSVTQVIYLLWAARVFPPEDDNERKGRAQTTNAAFIYFGATAVVIVAALGGILRPWLDPWALFVAVGGVLLLLFGLRHHLRRSRRQHSDDIFEDEPALPPPTRIRLAPNWYGNNITDADTEVGVAYFDYLSEELADRVYRWGGAFHASDDYADQQFWAQFDDKQSEAAHRLEGEEIARALTEVFGLGNVEGPIYPADIRYGPVREDDGLTPG